MRLFAAILALLALASTSSPATADHSDVGDVRVAIYRGPAACDDCSEALARAIARVGPRYRVEFVGPGEKADVTPATLARYRIYVQPGGGQDIDAALGSLGAARAAAIRGFVARGGGYLGLCMGAYLADASHLGLIAGDLDSEVRRPGFAVTTTADAVVPVVWDGKPRPVYYQDGPFLPRRDDDQAYRAIATYRNGDLAAARYASGKGTVVLSGPHPEADASWFEDAGLPLAAMAKGQPIKPLLDQFRS